VKNKDVVPISKSIKTSLKGMAEGKHLPKYKAMVKRVKRRIEGVGLSGKTLGRLDSQTSDAQKYSEFASNASSLTTQDEEGNITLGMFKGGNEGHWLQEQLGSLMRLRGGVVGAHTSITDKQIPRINKLLQDAKKRLRIVQRVIRKAEEQKRELEEKVKEIERAQKRSKDSVEAEIKDLERSLDKAQSAKNPNKQVITGLRSEISERKDSLSNTDKQTAEEITKIKGDIRTIDKENDGRHRVETSLTGSIIPTLDSKQASLYETAANLFGDGGEVGKMAFMGLKEIQGAGTTTGEIPNPPGVQEVGGELFNILNRMREIKEEAEKKPEVPEVEESELAELNKLAALDWQKKYLVSQAQYATLNNFPSVAQVASLPYAGSFAKGGVMMAEVGERGREILAAPQGSRVIPKHEVDTALRSPTDAPSLVIEELNVYEDGTVDFKAGGETFSAEVKKVTRKQARGAAKPSPGIKRRGK